MQIAVISDLHLGGKDRLDRFDRAHEAERGLLDFLRELEGGVDRVVLCGDVFETLRGPTPGPCEADLERAVRAYPELVRRITDDPRYRLVFGNHDGLTGTRLGAVEQHRESDHGLELLFFHGHQLDWLARGEAPLGRLGIWAGGLLERLGLPVTHRVDKARGRAYPKPDAPEGDPKRRERAAALLAKAQGADVVVNGHTHDLVRRPVGDVMYLNSGSCLSGRKEAVLIDTAGPTFDVIRR